MIIELRGPLMRVIQGKSDGISRRTEKELASEAEARVASDRMAAELVARGYVELVSSPTAPAVSGRSAVAARPVAATRAPVTVPRAVAAADRFDLADLADAADGDAVEGETLLPRLATAPASAETAPRQKKKKATGKKKKKQGAKDDGLDKRVIATFVALGLACVAVVGYLGYDTFLKPPSIIGHWEGSRTEHEIGKFLTHADYQLILDGQRRATMTLNETTSSGTYAIQGNQLKLTFKDEEGEVSETSYKVTLGRATLDLFDPTTGKKMVELIRYHAQSAALAQAQTKPVEAPPGLGVAPANPADDDRLVNVEFASKDAAFRLKRPASWEVESGSRPDNTDSWARFTQDSAKVQVYADIAGSLMAGSNQSQHEEGSELAPVHSAHELYKKQAMEDYSDYVESKPTLFKNAGMGEGRVATFTASGGGLFGSKVRGIRVTFLTNVRRISVLCEAPASQFAKYQPTFLALARSLAR